MGGALASLRNTEATLLLQLCDGRYLWPGRHEQVYEWAVLPPNDSLVTRRSTPG